MVATKYENLTSWRPLGVGGRFGKISSTLFIMFTIHVGCARVKLRYELVWNKVSTLCRESEWVG